MIEVRCVKNCLKFGAKSEVVKLCRAGGNLGKLSQVCVCKIIGVGVVNIDK